jgi:hypothetical protein
MLSVAARTCSAIDSLPANVPGSDIRHDGNGVTHRYDIRGQTSRRLVQIKRTCEGGEAARSTLINT